jgi:beta-galactosidase
MLARQVSFDVIGLSYYPKWHGTLNDLESNIDGLYRKYQKPVIVAEYSQVKKEVNKIAFSMPGSQMKGTFIWEPLSTWEGIFDKDGKVNKFLYYYDEIAKEFLPGKK